MNYRKILGALAVSGIAVHVTMVVRSLLKLEKVKHKYKKRILFAGQELNFAHETFEGDSMAVAFAGVNIDFRDATLEGNSATLDLYGSYCGIYIIVPKGWRVFAEGSAAFAGVDNETLPFGGNTNAPVLKINYDIEFSGIAIKTAE